MQTFQFRSRELIVESDEADLVRDVSLDIDKAQTKLEAIRQRLRGVQEQAAAQVQLLRCSSSPRRKPSSPRAIVAALLSRQNEAPAPISPDVTSGGWRRTLGCCGDNNGRGLEGPRHVL